MKRRLLYDVLAVALLSACGAAAIQRSDSLRGAEVSTTGALLPDAEDWALKPSDAPDAEAPAIADRRAVRIVYQPLVESR